MGAPVPRPRRGWDGRPVQPAAPLPQPAGPAHRAADPGFAGLAAVGAGTDRLPAALEPLHGAQGPGPLPGPTAGLDRPGRRGPATGQAQAGALRAPRAGGSCPCGCQQARAHPRRRRPPSPRPRQGNRIKKGAKPGTACVHNALDDHSRLAYSEVLPDETKETTAAFWHRANDYFAACGIIVKRVLTDNGSAYRSKAFATALGKQVTHKR